MENLKRYDFVPCSCVYESSEMVEEEKGEYVKFSDIKDILKTDTQQTKVTICPKCESRSVNNFWGEKWECFSCHHIFTVKQ